jgi:hypothetical protein
VDEVKASELDAGPDSKSETESGIKIIDAEPNATISTKNLESGGPKEPEKGKHIFHS